ncbi:GNAT family N-acetyltransferase [Sinorhizobium garamanticum]|uniref:GNAT family N-acetyltransferase n=1 Tax=Sinorhizobium garamanticum TaxID=680247 RepID=A0ABY8D6E5_9HYPH|nr:GNAT family N-acetyltransferase [Sinorhizobium garamanticum]WEX86444.1 GNAT family N-acetyltransferase [Sinorhizobium garamanticum]
MAQIGIEIRPAQSGDIAAIGEIVVLSWRHTFDRLISRQFLRSMSEQHQANRHARMFSTANVVYRVAITEGAGVVGFASGGPSRHSGFLAENELYAIYLKPGFERRGIGRDLFRGVADELMASRRNGLFLTALSVNPNRHFYRAMGGREVEAPSIELGNELYTQVAFVWDDMAQIVRGTRTDRG